LLSKNIKIRIYKTIILPVVSEWAWNLVSNLKKGTQTEDVREEGAEENL
jgi:hypothetical protein